jgi:TrmH family RNA methyltransferase
MSISKNELRQVRSLAQKKFRDESGRFVVEGEKMVSEALASGFEVVSVYRRDEIGEDAMARLSMLSSPSPVLAVVRQPAPVPFHPSQGLFLALDSIRDPGNLGTILRVADWFGIDGVVASPDTVELYNPKVVQATMGAIFRVPFHRMDIAALCRSFVSGGGHVYGTFLNGDNLYSKALDCGQEAPSVIVIGNESNGISPEVASCVSDRLFIPPYPADDPGSESLNAAIATAITVAEFRRRSL